MGKNSKAPDISQGQLNSARAGLQAAQTPALGIDTSMDSIPSMNSQWAGKNQPGAGYGDDMRTTNQFGGGGLTTGWQQPDQMKGTNPPLVSDPPMTGWMPTDQVQNPVLPSVMPPAQQASNGSTGASAALNILNNTQAGNPSAPTQPQRPSWGGPQHQWGGGGMGGGMMQRRRMIQ